MRQVVEALVKELMERGDVDRSVCFIDGSFCMAKKRHCCWQGLSEAKEPNSWQPLNAVDLVLSASIASASSHEVRLVGAGAGGALYRGNAQEKGRRQGL